MIEVLMPNEHDFRADECTRLKELRKSKILKSSY